MIVEEAVATPRFERPEWYDRASCRDVGPGLFYVERGASAVEAIAVCRGCPVRSQCLRLALERREIFGIWGGYSQRQLRAMRAMRRVRTTTTEGEAMNDGQDHQRPEVAE